MLRRGAACQPNTRAAAAASVERTRPPRRASRATPRRGRPPRAPRSRARPSTAPSGASRGVPRRHRAAAVGVDAQQPPARRDSRARPPPRAPATPGAPNVRASSAAGTSRIRTYWWSRDRDGRGALVRDHPAQRLVDRQLVRAHLADEVELEEEPPERRVRVVGLGEEVRHRHGRLGEVLRRSRAPSTARVRAPRPPRRRTGSRGCCRDPSHRAGCPRRCPSARRARRSRRPTASRTRSCSGATSSRRRSRGMKSTRPPGRGPIHDARLTSMCHDALAAAGAKP